jgi:hypothetical protein
MKEHDMNIIAYNIVGQAIGEAEADPEVRGQAGGREGGKARAKSLTSEQRKEIAEKAAAARWGKHE